MMCLSNDLTQNIKMGTERERACNHKCVKEWKYTITLCVKSRY